jgi:5-formyltetrahydrofolate cyclo-ligase
MRHDDFVPVHESKAEVRARIRASRAARSLAERDGAAAALAQHAGDLLPAPPAIVTCYLSMTAEPGTGSLVDAIHAAGLRAVVPRIEGRDLSWVELRPDSALRAGPMGIREPLGPHIGPLAQADVSLMLVPATAVDRHGRRLGQGGGYYDRVLSEVPSHVDGGPLLVAVVFDDEVLDTVPVEPHDCRVDAALTPSGVIRFD